MPYCEMFNFSHTFGDRTPQALSVSCCDNFSLSEETKP